MLDQLDRTTDDFELREHVTTPTPMIPISTAVMATAAFAGFVVGVEYLTTPLVSSLVIGTVSLVGMLRFCEWPQRLLNSKN